MCRDMIVPVYRGADATTAVLGSMNGGSEVSATDSNDRRVVDYGLGAVIDRYEQGTYAHPQEEDLSINKEVERIAERLVRMPTSSDPDIWRVRVRVRLYSPL